MFVSFLVIVAFSFVIFLIIAYFFVYHTIIDISLLPPQVPLLFSGYSPSPSFVPQLDTSLHNSFGDYGFDILHKTPKLEVLGIPMVYLIS